MLPLGADDPRVIGEFRLHRRLGAGGMGRVYLATSPGGRAVAVKVVHAHLADDAEFRDRFAREVAAAQAVNGAYTAPVIAAGPDDDPPWLATAYVAGPSLQEAVTETGALPEDAIAKLAAGLAEALHVIHDGGVVHRDLKPANVLLADDGPRVIDFGIARALDRTAATLPGSVIGTPLFMSPEQAQGQLTGPASDVFSLGGVLYFAATGSGPFGSGPAAIVLYRVVHTEPDLDRLPPDLGDLVAACLAKDPARRPEPAALAASLMGALPPEDGPPVFWPAPVVRLIADHQARVSAGLLADDPSSAETRVPTGLRPAGPVPLGPVPLGPVRVASRTPPLPASGTGPTSAAAEPPPGQTQPLPGMGRRRALATLAGMATAGLVVGGWELTRPGPAAAAAAPLSAADLAARHRISSLPRAKEIWSFAANAAVSATAFADEVLYAGTQAGAVYALDALTGRLLWRHLMDGSKGKTSFLAAASGVVVAANGYNGVEPSGYNGGVYGLDAKTGKLLWNVEDPFTGGLAVAGPVAYVATAIRDDVTGGVTALDTGTGEVLWTFDFPATVDIDGSPVVAKGVVYVTSTLGEVFAINATTGEQIWRFADPAVTFGSAPQVANGVVFAISSHDKNDNANPVLYGIGAGTGRVLWQRPLGAALQSFCGNDGSGVVFAVTVRELNSTSPGASLLTAVNAVNGQQLWQAPVAGSVYEVTPTPSTNVVYTGSKTGVLDAWQADTGNHVWSYQAGGSVDSLVWVQDGVAYFGSTNKRIYAVTVG
jgi:outer membrane protein assembly factor BamB